ncbi:sensor histidine kinase, partial [Cesiribacter andamanensis]|uniref:sensor histidine kinase n=1 Tax=Cesiribacter andamanensis TaxID=649507 RepID=UPI00058C348E
QDQGGVIISVNDSGLGISAKKTERIFDHTELDSTKGTHGESGTGLGLPLSKEMVELNGGRIWIDSTEGMGSTFHVWLPSAASAQPAASGQDTAPEQQQTPSQAQAGLISPDSPGS